VRPHIPNNGRDTAYRFGGSSHESLLGMVLQELKEEGKTALGRVHPPENMSS
jgi:hypothetical protein